MAEVLLTAFYLQIPVVIGGVLHMLAVTRNWLPALKKPVCVTCFGANKTWRGFILMPLLTAFGAVCLWPVELWQGGEGVFGGASILPLLPTLLLAGLIAGAGYTLAELPNSLIKRHLGIAPGETPVRHRALFILTDQIDSGIGVALAYAVYPGISWEICLTYAVTFPATALLVKRLLFLCQLKKSAT